MQAACWHPVVCLLSFLKYREKWPIAIPDFMWESFSILHIIKYQGEEPFESLYVLFWLFFSPR